MDNLLLILVLTFAGVALLVVVLERTAKPMDEAQQSKLSGWLYIALFLLMIGSLVRYFVGG